MLRKKLTHSTFYQKLRQIYQEFLFQFIPCNTGFSSLRSVIGLENSHLSLNQRNSVCYPFFSDGYRADKSFLRISCTLTFYVTYTEEI